MVSFVYGQKHARLGVALRATPVRGQLEKRCARRNLLVRIALRRIINVPANLALKTSSVVESLMPFTQLQTSMARGYR